MNISRKNENFELFLSQRNSLLIRGMLLTFAGAFLTVFSVMHPDVRIMSQSSSWLPVVAMVMLLASLMSGMDTFILRHSKEFFINLHISVVDFVVGLILLNELNKSVDRLILLAAAYLLIKGLFRIFAVINLAFAEGYSAMSGGVLSLLMGILLWQGWPYASMWFICFCLSLDIVTRGWALMNFGLWLRSMYHCRMQEQNRI